MKENQIVRMAAIFTVTAKMPIPYKKDGAEFHGLGATIEDKDIPFDFAAFNYNVEELGGNQYRFSYESGKGAMFNDYGLDECFGEEYKALDVRMEDLTAERIAAMTKLNEFLMEPDGEILRITIQKMVFSDGENDYPVSRNVLDQWEATVNDGTCTISAGRKKQSIDIGFANLCVEIDEQGIRPEIYIFLEGKKNMEEYQEICMVSQMTDPNTQAAIPNHVQCLVWADGQKEDYTNRFIIPYITQNEQTEE